MSDVAAQVYGTKLQSLLQLLLDAELVRVTTALLAAVCCAGGETGIASEGLEGASLLAANLLVLVGLAGKYLQGGLNDATTKAED